MVVEDVEDLGMVVREVINCIIEVEISYFLIFLKYYLFLVCVYCGSVDSFLDDIDFYIFGLFE